ncbi:unnamed protein product [Linum tenue]|uniref:Uncharacterized protein n=1 Tax=Linum tenue TaxID=586396 RepID=A0AAV0HDZ3_9ROSI|nr:unnamed protein product [Linum tenue]
MVLKLSSAFSFTVSKQKSAYAVIWTFNFELKQTFRQEMENNWNCNDRQTIRFLMSDGLERLKRLDETLDMQGR